MESTGFSGALTSWTGMFRRCLDETEVSYRHYGARGITICERWYDWRNFYADMGGRPPNTSLDRINNDGNYEPSNCRWATDKQQMRNTRRNVTVVLDGVEMLQVDAARLLGVRDSTVFRRAKAGKDIAEKHGMRLTRTQALELRARCVSPKTDDALAAEYGISRQAVSNIRKGKSWKEAA